MANYQSLGSRVLGKRLVCIHQAIVVCTVATLFTALENGASASVSNIRITHCLLRNSPDALVFFTRNLNYSFYRELTRAAPVTWASRVVTPTVRHQIVYWYTTYSTFIVNDGMEWKEKEAVLT